MVRLTIWGPSSVAIIPNMCLFHSLVNHWSVETKAMWVIQSNLLTSDKKIMANCFLSLSRRASNRGFPNLDDAIEPSCRWCLQWLAINLNSNLNGGLPLLLVKIIGLDTQDFQPGVSHVLQVQQIPLVIWQQNRYFFHATREHLVQEYWFALT